MPNILYLQLRVMYLKVIRSTQLNTYGYLFPLVMAAVKCRRGHGASGIQYVDSIEVLSGCCKLSSASVSEQLGRANAQTET